MKNKNNTRQDFYFKKAKEENYPARSVYKLKEIDDKYQIIKRGDIVLDLGCAPGSWSLYLSRKVGSRGEVIGIDLRKVEIERNENLKLIQGDIKDYQELIQDEKIFDVIVSDMAPDTTGIHSLDVGKSLELVNIALEIVRNNLRNGGSFVCKIFEGEGTEDFLRRVKLLFSFVKQFRPNAVRKHSREFYLIAKNKK